MNNENPNEMWQVEVGGQVYEAALAELPEWIGEGSLQPDDKVRKGNLRWIEARRVPTLIPFFNARANGEPMPFVSSVTEPVSGTDVLVVQEHGAANTFLPTHSEAAAAQPLPKIPPGDMCIFHPEVPTAWTCSSCSATLCKGCSKSYGGNVRICPECGSMCRSTKEVAELAKQSAIASRSTNEGFGFADLIAAFAHPFKFKSSLFFGGLMYMFFTLGQSAAGIGGIFMIGASLVCVLLSNMLTFGVLANTITNFTQGNLESDFMPSFEDFSVWDDVVHPFFLSIGAYLSSFGPFLLVATAGAYMVFSSLTAQTEKFNAQVSKIPGTEMYAPDRTAEQSQQVKDLLAKVKQNNDRLLKQKETQVAAAESSDPQPLAESPGYSGEDQAVELERSLKEARAAQIESIAGASSDPESQYRELATSILKIAAPLVVAGMLALLWGIMYFPAACAVAGYTRSFAATINPLVGLDTIRRLGLTYVKILLIMIGLTFVLGLLQGILAAVLSPFAMPRVGNLPAIAIGSFLSFYIWTVFFCVLGYALFKSADRLKLYR